MSRINSVLIANRGEIACRVIRTARRLGLSTVAVYSDADADAMHVAMADRAVHIGSAPARESYLLGERIIEAAKAAGADAIHPGYGFLSENAAFADGVAAAGLVFIGPPASAIRAMGGKSEAKALMEGAGVPLVPGYHGADQDEALLAAEAARIGFPVLIKASAGGGGKGMKVAESAAEFPAALASAKREAKASFGDDRVLIEKYLARPRHVEIQVFADSQGDCVYLFERDCSIQRRHQKVVEEAPAPGMDPAIRARMGAAAVAAAKAIGYVGAGTVEFLLDSDNSFYFMEMNTRLQVEHPVTEAITGQDLVEWQLRVAAGEPLPLRQDQLAINGHAIEVRLYAEDPAKGFLPQTGRLNHLRFPEAGPHVRVDTGVRAGDAISIHYDPMIAKLIVWDRDRASAVQRLRRALAATEIGGLNANVPFLSAIAAHPGFLAADLDTRFIDRYGDDLLPPHATPAADVLALASLGLALSRHRAGAADPWDAVGGLLLNLPALDKVEWREPGEAAERLPVTIGWRRDGFVIQAGGREMQVRDAALAADGTLTLRLDDQRLTARWVRDGEGATLFHAGGTYRLLLVDPHAGSHGDAGSHGRLTAPMPGKVIALLVEEGAVVTKGQPVIVLEAMKMEHTLKAPADGTVTHLRYQVGDQVAEGLELVGFEAA
ncbi:acetyl/propionyl/methylcrotonyl-CoA carboxylase subunit alpha [Niveispirillum sp. BGYR6]|uniref:acetyl/propionyl/methylcrotonyl-CoA carboxylase subunit alpha n=1 Tax=Niveispirillum sp. BGYR6 TaxID=2971249 RepID=UPI0022B99EB2|nr:acetyl/propionyl/methylcrotonyl-CoA carboxylase subunit alpha [Niveispirillum sp. BGYR6]MDG5493517.1 acetyl/propionyl/methylcrotonyl-CoA carboxylase subunit alpha [Niveispirillum sp. BGYR6]